MNKVRFATILMILASLNEDAFAQEGVPAAEPLVVSVYTTIGTVEWRKPDEVRQVLIVACGGGAGGDAANQNASYSSGGAARLATVVVPVTGDIYHITIGAGGKGGVSFPPSELGGKPGGATVFEGTIFGKDKKLEFSGGLRGAASSVNGEGAVFGPGGEPGKSAPADSYCAGGGREKVAGFGGPATPAGAGAGGFLALYPLPDVQRFANVLATLERLNAPQTPAEASAPAVEGAPASQSAAGE